MAGKGIALTRNDTAWFRMDSATNLMVVTGFFKFARPVTTEAVKQALYGGFLKYDRFKQRVVEQKGLGKPRWVDDEDFDVDQHVVEEPLPAPGDDAALRAAVEVHMRTPLPRDRPLWEMRVMTGYGQGCALFFRVHHCIADGIALMQVLLGMCEQVEGAANEAPLAKPKRPWWFWPALPVTGTWWALKYLWVSNYLMYRPKDSATVYKGELSGTKRLAWAPVFRLADVKATAKAAGVKINDLLMAVASGALRRYAEGRGESLDAKTVRVMIPVNLRSAKAAENLGNKFALVTPTLPVDRTDAVERLKVTKKRMDRLKKSPEPFATVTLMNLLGLIGTKMQHKLQRYLVNKGSLAMSNVPGPRKKLRFAGETIEQILFWVPVYGPTALGLSIFSYAGEVTVGVMADEARVPDPQALADAFAAELESYRAALLSAPKALEHKAPEADAA